MELEVRLWDTSKKKMLKPRKVIGKNFYDMRHCIPFLYSGLEDKNGVDIYEGDIIRSFHFKGPRNKKNYLYHQVVYSQKYATFMAVSRGSNGMFDLQPGNVWLWVLLKEPSCEVVGNIYENPELMNGDKQ